MATLYNQYDKNIRLTWVYISMFLIFVIGVGYVFAGAMGSSTALYVAVAFSTITSVVSYWWSDKIVLSMSGAKELMFADNKELYRLVENLTITAGLPLPKIYTIEDTALNAFATGRDPQHGVVCLTTGIINRLERSELEGVIAHELSHIGNRDTLLSTVVVILVGFVALLADWFRHWAWFGGSRDNDSKNQLQVILMVAAIILSILAPLFAMLIQLAISRKREFLADASGALLTRYPEGLASALEKISGDTEPLEAANRATAHLYIANPFKGKNLTKLFMTHPPIEERIAALRGMEIK
ncbi:MAG: M48 family metallopeptidase [Candidatus Moranbacteria bacterium]|nr:M48 family metallopeptidase [Candidatus Moranbacteria bacterium]OIQ02541.1 MAG: zinc metalloprotease HtpX [Candidatus Moranbacteria bacterium CG2_30_41_165]PIP25213.1 MAG: zinc metalloprotease HtpX [Candidatus Moranbacteria bacterium CG23_combo_of_CG06-09_8_20_14_all_41_28]PIW93709.1 MAG: zinc metalloprotease HtpX [Candidatus Moranbacteria bacterium CG_4_8_14_3_um_filter_41_13]